MAKKTNAQLEAENAELQKKLKAFEEAEAKKETAVGEETVPKAEFEKLETQFKNVSVELEELTLKYESDPELALKVDKAVKTLLNKPKALLFKKISLALGEVKRIPKNGWNDFFKYKYSQEGDILDGIRPILSEVGLMVWTTISEDERKIVTYYKHGKEQGQRTITKVKVNFIIGCADTGETLESNYLGEGEDESDKGLYKAYTGATKYFLTKNFLISSGDILQDDVPNDPEADTQRRYDQQTGRQNSQSKGNQRQNQNQGPREGIRQEAQEEADKRLQAEKDEMKGIWVKLAGSDEGFEGFYNKQTKQKGASHASILNFLNGELAKKQAESEKQAAESQEPPQETQQPPTEGDNSPPPLEPVNTANKSVDEMTPEEYLQYTEDNLPFPLTPSEREQILNDAREGNRNHRR